MKNRIFTSVAIVGLVFGSSVPSFAQWVVIDPASIAKSVEQIAHQVEQIKQLEDQIAEAKKLYDSMNQITGIKDLAGLLNSDEIKRALPDDFGQIQTALNGLIDGNREKYDHYDTSGSAANNFYLQELERQKEETYTDLSIGEQVYETASKRIDELQKLNDAVGTAVTQKQILDLQARIAAESALLQNDQIKMQALAMVQQARDRVDNQRALEQRQKDITATVEAANEKYSN